MKRISVLFAGLALSFSATLPACADVVFNQPTDGFAALISETSTGSNGFLQEFDNFSLAKATTINTLSWTGWTLVGGSLNGFTVSFYQNDSTGPFDVPGTLITPVYSVDAALDNAVKVGDSGTGFGVYQYSTTISFAADAGIKYWVSIVGDTESDNSWNWATSNAFQAGASEYQVDDKANGSFLPTDLAFSLADTTPVPEPSGLVLAGSGMFALFGVARRRFAGR